MKRRSRIRNILMILMAGLIVFTEVLVVQSQEHGQSPPGETAPPTASTRWSFDEAIAQLRLYPRDPYLQYVVLQLARRENKTQAVIQEMDWLTRQGDWQRGRADQVNLFSVFTGALAVQESLQLDTMIDPNAVRLPGATPVPEAPAPEPAPGEEAKRDPEAKMPAGRDLADRPANDRDSPAARVSITDLQGPTVKSHPWSEMLAGRKPAMSPLARLVPDDFYYIQFRSVNKLLILLEQGDIWGTHLFSQTAQKAYRHEVREHTLRQLALETHPLLQPFYDLAVQEMAVVGSDLFVTEGSDVTLLFRIQQSEIFKAQMDGFLTRTEQNIPGVVRQSGSHRNVPFVHLTTPDRTVHVYSAYPSDDLHVRSNSLVALRRILDLIIGTPGSNASSLGATDEFAYISTLFPYGADEEDGLIYLSDPFIRHMVGPQLKLTESRRRVCYNYLRMLGHACALYRTEHAGSPQSLDELDAAGCTPGKFGTGRLVCPSGGHYSLAGSGQRGVCSHHGTADYMIPCCEIPQSDVSSPEADAYRAFVDQYSQYWRTFFDPIAVRVQVTPERYRLETIVLPLIDSSLYMGLAAALGGPPQLLDVPPLPDRTIFSASLKVDKPALLQQMGWAPPEDDGAGQSLAMLRQTRDQLRQLGLAMHNYHDVHKVFPAVANFDSSKRPLLSWRVHVLPFLGAQALYEKFRRDEPWDSPHNRSLIEQMPDVFKSLDDDAVKPGTTRFVVPVGNETLFRGTDSPISLAGVRDGTSNTILTLHVTAKHAVVWTKPDDHAFDAKTLRDALFGGVPGKAMVGFADGSVRLLPATIDDPTLRALFTREGGEVVPEIPDAGPRPRRGIFGLSAMLPGGLTEHDLHDFVVNGLGDQIALHTYDADQFFDFQLIGSLGQALGSFSGRRGFGFDSDFLPFVFLGASLNSPVYLSVRLADPQIVDNFLNKLDESLAALTRRRTRDGFFRVDQDFYRLPLAGNVEARSFGLQVGPVKWRFFWARLGDSLYIASKPYILEDLAAKLADSGENAVARDGLSQLRAHAMIRIRPQHWKHVLPAYRLGWAERHRLACLENVGRLSSVARLVNVEQPALGQTPHNAAAELDQPAGLIYGLRFYCPEGGDYVRTGDSVHCLLHGTALQPRQQAIPANNVAIDAMLQGFTDLTVALTFLEDGLHAVLLIERN
ncbi:MAG: DUF1559 family PulG-like putative transporter [Pirellulaceae bacterium]